MSIILQNLYKTHETLLLNKTKTCKRSSDDWWQCSTVPGTSGWHQEGSHSATQQWRSQHQSKLFAPKKYGFETTLVRIRPFHPHNSSLDNTQREGAAQGQKRVEIRKMNDPDT